MAAPAVCDGSTGRFIVFNGGNVISAQIVDIPPLGAVDEDVERALLARGGRGPRFACDTESNDADAQDLDKPSLGRIAELRTVEKPAGRSSSATRLKGIRVVSLR